MAYGKLAAATLAANTDTVVYTVPDNCLYADLTINILNPDVTDATAQLAIAAADTPAANEYVEKGVVLPANGGILERTNVVASPGERIVVRSTLATTVVRVSGKTVLKA